MATSSDSIAPCTKAVLPPRRSSAARAGTDERYTREWLEQQATAGFLACDNHEAAAAERRFRLPEGYEAVLVDPNSPMTMAPFGQVLRGTTAPVPELLQAFRSGAGVPSVRYGQDWHEGQTRANRPALVNLLAQVWLPVMSDVAARLQADPPARIADVGVGQGFSSIALARAYPKARIDGFDLDEATAAAVRENARGAGVADRIDLLHRKVDDPALSGKYDLVLAIEYIHDLAQPVAVLAAMRRLLSPGGVVLIVDERVPDAFAPDGDEIERLLYGASVLHCLPVGRAVQPSVETGRIMRRPIFLGYANAAGFCHIDELPIENDMWRFYRLTP